MTTEDTISRKIQKLKNHIYIKNPKGYYRTIWVKFHPDVQKLARVGTKMSQGEDKNDTSTGTKPVHRLGQKCPTTYTNTNTENNRETAADLPLPAGGQASRLLVLRSPSS
jgi:hypothetical protein